MCSYASPAQYCPREALHRSGTDCPSGVRPPRQQLRIALRGQIRPHSDVLPYRRGQCTQYGWAAMGLRHLSWMISPVHDESRTIPRVDAALDQLRSLQRPNPHQPVLLDTRGSTARVAHLEETVATPEIKPPDEEFDEIGQHPVRHLLRQFAFTNSSTRAGTASGRRLRSAAVDSFNPTTRSS